MLEYGSATQRVEPLHEVMRKLQGVNIIYMYEYVPPSFGQKF